MCSTKPRTNYIIQYMSIKILRLSVNSSIQTTFRTTGYNAQITKNMIEDEKFVEQCIGKELSH